MSIQDIDWTINQAQILIEGPKYLLDGINVNNSGTNAVQGFSHYTQKFQVEKELTEGEFLEDLEESKTVKVPLLDEWNLPPLGEAYCFFRKALLDYTNELIIKVMLSSLSMLSRVGTQMKSNLIYALIMSLIIIQFVPLVNGTPDQIESYGTS